MSDNDGLRHRGPSKANGTVKPVNSNPAQRIQKDDDGPGISLLDILRILLTLVVLSCALSYYITPTSSLIWGYSAWFTNPKAVIQYFQGPVVLTLEELSQYNGTDLSKPIYLAINSTIFDVSASPHTYGPGGSYSVFAGRDATRAFVTGCFADDTTSDLRGAEEIYLPVEDVEDEGLSSGEKKVRAERERREARGRVRGEVEHWVQFYKGNAKYFEVGRVVQETKEDEGPPPVLCEVAQKGRPKRSKMNSGKNKKQAAPGKPVQ
jgi:predicted heme/steroid binding protein